MPRWGLVVEQNLGYGRQQRVWSAEVIGHMDGTREEALAALRQRAERFEPLHPADPKRRALYRSEDGLLLFLDGILRDFHRRFTVAERSTAGSLWPSCSSTAEHPDRGASRTPHPSPNPHRSPNPPRSRPDEPCAGHRSHRRSPNRRVPGMRVCPRSRPGRAARICPEGAEGL